MPDNSFLGKVFGLLHNPCLHLRKHIFFFYYSMKLEQSQIAPSPFMYRVFPQNCKELPFCNPDGE